MRAYSHRDCNSSVTSTLTSSLPRSEHPLRTSNLALRTCDGYPVGVSRVFALSIHADYRCRHSGVCCSSDWDVPVDVPVYRTLDEAMRSRRLLPTGDPHDGGGALIVADDLPDGAAAMVARTTSGHCVFYHRPSGLCAVHRDLGRDALPVTCRHFPRLAVRDRRGTSISLTHYCPTAAGMLFRDVPIGIVSDPPAFPPADYEGLVIDDDDWPPLLMPNMLMDFDAYAAWEKHMVGRCAEASASPEGVVTTLARDAAALLDFNPEREQLIERIAALPRQCAVGDPPESLHSSLEHWLEVMAAVPDDLKPDADDHGLEEAYVRFVRPGWPEWQSVLRRYLAAKAFANWTAYQGRGLPAIVLGLEAALALVRVSASRACRDSGTPVDELQLREAIRSADFALNHLAVGEDLAEAWSAVTFTTPV